MRNRTEYRAIYRTPPTVLDTSEERVAGYVERATEYGTSRRAVKAANHDLSRTDESRAWIVRWERRTVAVGEWETVRFR